MIDVGHPFSRAFQDLIDSLVGSLQLGVEQPASLDILYRSGTRAYPLQGPGPVSGLAEQITGFVGGKPAVFDRGRQYVYSVGQLVWLDLPVAADPDVVAGWFPDDNSRLTVGYLYRDLPSGITDFNAGSVAGTLVRAVARELKLVYEQMDQAYQRAFIDYAKGAALDNVVALLGISRGVALAAQGEVTFWLKKAAKADVAIAAGTRVADARGRMFKVTVPGAIHPTRDDPTMANGKTVRTLEPIGTLVHVRMQGTTFDLPTVPTKPGKPYGDDEMTVTLTAAVVPPGAALTVTYAPKRPSVTVPVIALDPGRQGNLGSGSLTVMPTPPRGVDGGVSNDQPLTGGEEAEADDELRERAKHALERAGNATLNAIRYAVLSIDGVDSVEVRDFSIDQTIPLGETWVRVSTGKSDVMPKVEAIVEQTRAAGIKARVTEVTPVILSGTLYVVPDVAGSGPDAFQRYKDAVVAALAALGIGEPVSPRKLAALVFQVTGLADVAEVQLSYARDSDPPVRVVGDPLLVDPGEQARPDDGAIGIVPVTALAASAASLAANGTLALTLKALDDAKKPIRFDSFQLAVTATVRAKPQSTPNQPLQQVAQVTGTAVFAATDSTQPSFPKLVIPNLATLDAGSIELDVYAAAYPGIAAGTTKLTT